MFIIEKEELYDLYIGKNMSAAEIAEYFNVGIDCIKHKIKKFSIKKSKDKIVEKIKGSSLIKRKKTCLIKYGTEHPAQSNYVKNKTKESNIKKYGVEYPTKLQIVKEKIANTNMQRYGAKCAIQNSNIRIKSKETLKAKYGVDNPAKSIIVQNKMKETNLKRYGVENPGGTKESILKARETMKRKYGASNSMAAACIKEKIKNTNLQKYGVPFYCMTENCKRNNGYTISKVNEKISYLFRQNDIPNEFEKSIFNYSYDIAIKDTNIVIEINPTYTHNSTLERWFNNYTKKPLEKDYHYKKTLIAKENGYRCIHIWDWDNIDKIINMLKPKDAIPARMCTIRKVLVQDATLFLNENHLQGTCKGQDIILGLYYNDELVQLISFGKPRYNKKYEYELLRLCSSSKYTIMGGTEKLFKNFIKKYNPQNIISYCDNSKFDGNVYIRLGFELLDYGRPSKHWYNIKTKKHITDNLLRQRGYDQLFKTNYGKGTSNKELMIENGFVEIYDSGQSTYQYINN